jgi:hypothetical protein
MKTLALLITIAGLVAVGCGGTSSSTDGGASGGQSGAAGTAGAAGRGGRGGSGAGGQAGGLGGVGGQLAGIPAACESCAVGMCTSQLLACDGNAACLACVQNDFHSCITNGNSQYLAVCNCAKGPCAACAPYCP